MLNYPLLALSLMCALAMCGCATHSPTPALQVCAVLPPLSASIKQPPSYQQQISNVFYKSPVLATRK